MKKKIVKMDTKICYIWRRYIYSLPFLGPVIIILSILIYVCVCVCVCVCVLDKEMATHSSILAWRIPWTEEPGRLQTVGSQRVGHDWATNHRHTHTHTHMPLVCLNVKRNMPCKSCEMGLPGNYSLRDSLSGSSEKLKRLQGEPPDVI